MIIYGSRAAFIKSVPLNRITCSSCNTKGSVVMSFFRKHAHVFWIPLFPFGKTAVSECQHCKNTLSKSEMPQDLKAEYNRLKGEAKGPIWQFSGLLLIAAIVVWSKFNSDKVKKEEVTFIAQPKAGDIYKIKVDSSFFSTLKVTEVTVDSVFVLENLYKTDKRTSVRKLEKPENYDKEDFGVAKTRIKELYDQGEIYGIKRD